MDKITTQQMISAIDNRLFYSLKITIYIKIECNERFQGATKVLVPYRWSGFEAARRAPDVQPSLTSLPSPTNV